MTSPAAGAALAAQRYFALYGATSAELAAVPIAFRKHARLNPAALMTKPLTLDDHQRSRWIIEPLHLYDCCVVSDGAACVLVTTAERARDGRKPPVRIAGMQGMRAGRAEVLFGRPGLGLWQQPADRWTTSDEDLLVYRMASLGSRDVGALYTYDAFSPLVWFVLERFGFCGAGEAAAWVQGGRIELGGELPMNTSGGLLSEAHVSGWNSIVELVRQLRGEAGSRQIDGLEAAQWATCWGDSLVFRR
jgi:acetyl-CoA acetyltransferase